MDAEWIGVIVALTVGGGGVVVGAIGLTQARKARAEAKAANDIAREANDISQESNRISLEANDISRSSADRAAERLDVDWQGTWRSPGEYVLINKGSSPTRSGRVTVTVDDEEAKSDFDELQPGEPVVLRFPRAGQAHYAEEREYQRYLAQRDAPRTTGGLFSPASLAGLVMPPATVYHFIRERIVWNSPLGAPHLHDVEFRLASVSPD